MMSLIRGAARGASYKCWNTPLSLQPAMDNEISPLQSQGIVNYGPCNCNSIIYYHPCNGKGNVNYGPCNCKPLSIRLPWQLQGYCQLVLQDLLAEELLALELDFGLPIVM